MPTRDPLVEEVITLTGGRKLGYCEHGLADGEPIIFFPGAGFGRRCVPTPFPNLLVDHGVRLIAVDRPGYGLSDLHPGRCYRDWAEDVRQLMEHLKLDKARFLAHSAGTAHLAAVCAFAPELVAVASLVCPVSPIVGDPPHDRPYENFSRGCARVLLLYGGWCLDGLFGAVVSSTSSTHIWPTPTNRPPPLDFHELTDPPHPPLSMQLSSASGRRIPQPSLRIPSSKLWRRKTSPSWNSTPSSSGLSMPLISGTR